MQITLTAEMQALFEQQLSRANDDGPEDVIATALRVLSDSTPNDLADLDVIIQEGLDDLDNGRTYDGAEVRAYLKAFRERL